MNTTNYTNLKTNNFIFFENSNHHKDNEIYKQIKSLIKHNSSNNISNINDISKAVNSGYYLNETINIIKLIWEYDLYNSN